MNEALIQIILLATQALLWCAFLVMVQAASRAVGLSLIFLLVGAVQFPQTLLAISLYLQVAPQVAVSPGSTVLFSGTLFAVLLVYLIQGPLEARRMIYGLFGVNIFLSLFMFTVARQIESPLALNVLGLQSAVFFESARVIVVGSILLLLDIILIVAVYEFLGKYRLPRFLQMFLALFGVLSFDGVLFVSFSFAGHPDVWQILGSSLVGKGAMALIYSAALTYAARRFGVGLPTLGFGQTLAFLTFRFDMIKLIAQVERDALTGTFSRRYLNRTLERSVDDALRNTSPMALMMVDADHFKRINDEYGHAVGDEVLVAIANTIMEQVRAEDVVCRFGGEEFAVVMPGANIRIAAFVAERVRRAVQDCADGVETVKDLKVTVSIGVAALPEEAAQGDALLRLADARLYAAKASGRNRVEADGRPKLDRGTAATAEIAAS